MNLFNFPVINIAVAIIISWALFAIFCSLVYEAFAQLKAERGRFMKKYILLQLQDFPNGVNWGSLLYMHGNVDMLSRAPGKPSSDVQPCLFAETLIDVVATAHLVQVQRLPADLEYVTNGNVVYVNGTLANFKKATQTLLPSDMMMFLTQALKSAELNSIQSEAIDESVVYKKLVANIQNWYTELTQRLTLWYKKKTRKYLFVIGALLAFFVNVDSIQLFGVYRDYPAKSQAVASFYNSNAGQLQSDSTNLKIVLDKLGALQKETLLPVGYDFSAIHLAMLDKKIPQPQIHAKTYWFWKIIGVLISGFAASFGGPFWFDVLKKIYSKNP